MRETLSESSSVRDRIPRDFVLTLGALVRDLRGLPDAVYACSQSCALGLFRKLQRVSYNGQANEFLQEDKVGAWSLLIACMNYANNHGVPISFPDIAASNVGPTAWDRNEIRGNLMFMMRAVEVCRPTEIPEL
jgi:hypothetical protein